MLLPIPYSCFYLLESSSCDLVRLYSIFLKLLAYPMFSTAWRVQPRNYLLFACHATNSTAQAVQDFRFVNYWYRGGREEKLALEKGDVVAPVDGPVTQAIKEAKDSKKA